MDGSHWGIATDLDCDYKDSSLATDDEDQEDGPNEEILLWDSFKCTMPQPKSGSMVENRWYEVILRIIKILLYIFLFTVILGGSIIAKGTAFVATSQLSQRSVRYCNYYLGNAAGERHIYEAKLTGNARISWIWCIILSFAVPEALDFLCFLWNCFFVDVKLPKTRHVILISVIEILQTAGVALLFFVVLPHLDVLQGLTSLTTISVIPSALGLLSKCGYRQNKSEFYFYIFGDIIAFLCQVGGIISFTYIALENENGLSPWTLPIAFILSSLRWWGNYVSNDSRFGFIKYLAKSRKNLQAHRPVLIGYTSLLRISVFLMFSFLISFWNGVQPNTFFEGFWMKDYDFVIKLVNDSFVESSIEVTANLRGDRWIPFRVFLIHVASSLCVYNCGKYACKTLMQGFGFALPLNLVLPVGIVSLCSLIALRIRDECTFHEVGVQGALDYLFFTAPSLYGYVTHWRNWLWILWLLSQVWITRHIWYTRNERLATADRIFAVSSYDTLFVDQSLAMSRWREDFNEEDSFDKSDNVEEPIVITRNSSSIKNQDLVTRIYACATMWHETPEEMTDFLNSILRLDRDQCIMSILKKNYRITSPDYYELEVHIFFDDAYKCAHGCSRRCLHDENKTKVNDYVVDFLKTVENCIRMQNLRPSPPIKYPTPYGGRLVWILPEKTKMFLHLKDKNRIRTKKRWSQVMYMYYLLGYRLMELPIEVERKEVIAENTYILTLDGDIDFRPNALRTLIDRMKINKDLGSACGRIHPVGKGPLVWFQKFEYAIGHWLQKSSEHTTGCVLCAPGCFALFRAKALMDYNVIKKYATVPTEPRHFIQYDQGEDRWLCTLLLQMGYKVEYSAASDAYTHAPETFTEFYIQRRRWIPSTIANIFDLLESAKRTKKVNRDISMIYIYYQWILMGSTILGPGTIFLMLVGAFVSAFQIDNWSSFCYNLTPILIFSLVCYYCKEKTQLLVAGVITAMYGLVMVVVLVGIMIEIAEHGWLVPSTLLFFVVAGELVITGLLHPLELSCLGYGVIYYVTVPSMYMLLIIFSLFNMNNISWGTRDASKAAPDTLEGKQNEDRSNRSNEVSNVKIKNERGFVEFSIGRLFQCILCMQKQQRRIDDRSMEINSTLRQIGVRLDELKSSQLTREVNPVQPESVIENREESNEASYESTSSDVDSNLEDIVAAEQTSARESNNFLVSPKWLHDKNLGPGEVEYLNSEEEIFWKQFIRAYLDPIDKDEKQEAQIAEQIKELRDQYIYKFFMINALFVFIVFLMQLNKEILHFQWPLGVKYNVSYNSDEMEVNISKEYLRLEPIGCVFIIGFVSILCIQFVAMLFHRFDTFSHIMAKVTLDWYCCNKDNNLSEDAIIELHSEKIKKELQRQIDRDAKSAFDHNNLLPPRMRMTVHETISGSEKKYSCARTFGTTVQDNLDDYVENGNTNFASNRISRMTLQALQRRRTTILREEKESQLIKNEYDDRVCEKPEKKSRRTSHVYENSAFAPEEFIHQET